MNTIIFVDNDSKWIANYKRVLTPYQKELHCVFFCHSEEAMEYISTHPVEVLVSELDMPVMSGSELFEMMDLLSPQTVKIGITQVRKVSDTLDMLNQIKLYKLILKPFFVAEDLIVPIREALKHYEENVRAEEIIRKVEEKLQELNQETEELQKKLAIKEIGHDKILRVMSAAMNADLSAPVADFDSDNREAVKHFCSGLLREFFQYYMYEKKNLIFYISYLKNKFHFAGKSCVFDIRSNVKEEIPVTVMNRIAYASFLAGFLCEQCRETYHVENMLEMEENHYVLYVGYEWGGEDGNWKVNPVVRKILHRIAREQARALSDHMIEKTNGHRRLWKLCFKKEEGLQ